MAVVLIISILVGIATASYIVSTSMAKETTCKANIRTINEELLHYFATKGNYPAALDDLVPGYIRDAGSLRCPNSDQPYDYDPVKGEVSCPTCPP